MVVTTKNFKEGSWESSSSVQNVDTGTQGRLKFVGDSFGLDQKRVTLVMSEILDDSLQKNI